MCVCVRACVHTCLRVREISYISVSIYYKVNNRYAMINLIAKLGSSKCHMYWR